MSRTALWFAVVLPLGCTTQLSADLPAQAAPSPAPAVAAPAKIAAPPSAARPPAAPIGEAPKADAPRPAAPAAAPPLTAEELALIEKDPKDLTPELRRKRAYALRKKIMQNPNSPTARAIEDLRKAAEAGEIAPPGGGPHFEARLPDKDLRRPPAGTRPGQGAGR